MKLQVVQVIGLNTDQKAAQVLSSIRDNENTFFAVLDLTCDDAFTKGRQILSELSDFYFEFEGSPSEKLNATFETAKEKFSEGEFSLLIASISGKVLYLISKGEVEAHLKREGKLSPLLSVGAPTQLISGFIQEGDKILFSTKTLISFLGEDLEKSINLGLEEFEQEVTDRIGSTEVENQGLAALLLEVEAEPQEGIPSLEREETASEISYRSSEESQEVISKASILPKLFTGIRRVFSSIRSHFPKSGRGRLILAVILIVVIALGVGFKVKATKDAQALSSFNESMQGAKDDFNGAKGLASLNPAEAKNKLDSAKDKVNKALALKPNNSDAQNLKKQIEEESGSILKQSEVSDFPVFLDLDLVKKNFRATQMSLSDGKLLIMDPLVRTLVIVDIAKKSNQILAGSDQLGEANFTSLNGGLAFVYSKDKGVIKIDTTNKKVTTVAKTDPELGETKDIYAFASNIYILDSGKNMIWKYLATSDGYSDKREYLSKATKADFSNSLRMQIESSVYVLKSGGEILRFTKGDKDNFGLQGLDKGVKDPKSIFVSSDTDDFYILDSGNSRLLILTKTGTYKGQIAGAEFGKATDLVVDEKGKKVYLLDGSKIYSVDLK